MPPPARLGAELPGCVFADRCALADTAARPGGAAEPRRRAGHKEPLFVWVRASALPREEAADLELPRVARGEPALVEIRELTKARAARARRPRAHRVSAAVWAGETLGLVGESGSGKTTLARTLLGIVAATRGTVTLDGRTLPPTYQKRSRDDLRSLQIVFQNPDSALNRRHSVQRILLRSMGKLAGIGGAAADARLRDLVSRVRVTERTLTQKPVQLSGGLKQRVAIARAFAGDPKLVVCDEPTSALDVSVQAAILNLLVELQAEKRVAYLFISHDLGVVRYISDRSPCSTSGGSRSSVRPTSSSTARTILTPRRCSRPCRPSMAEGVTASGCKGTCQARPLLRLAASSIRAVRAFSETSASSRSLRSSRPSRVT